jgi:YgiT-type zinc finger domain-containing protein
MSNASNPLEPITCFECDGVLVRVTIPDRIFVRGYEAILDVPMLQCPNCGDTVLGDEGLSYIEEQKRILAKSMRKSLTPVTDALLVVYLCIFVWALFTLWKLSPGTKGDHDVPVFPEKQEAPFKIGRATRE